MKVRFIVLIISFLIGGNYAFGAMDEEGTDIPVSSNGDSWTQSNGTTASGSRTLPLPFSASVMNNQSVVVNFYEAIGEVAITISTVDGQVLYQALENIISPQGLSISIPLTSEETLLLEFSNSKGAYASGTFTLSE